MKTFNMNRLIYVMVIAVVCQATLIDAKAGDDKRRGTAGASYLLVPVTARHAALGNTLTAGLSNLNGIEALYSNPAGLMANDGSSVMFSRMEYVADISVNSFGFAQRVGNNNLALFVTSWDFGDIPKQTELEPEISSVTFDPSIITIGASYARQFTDRIAAGVSLKAISEDLDDISGSAVAFDAGMTYVIPAAGIRLGVSLRNFGSKISYDGVGLTRQVRIPNQRPDATTEPVVIDAESPELPSLLNVGITYTREIAANTSFSVMGNFRSNSFDQDQFAGGLEFAIYDVLFLRGGIEFTEDQDLTFYKGTNFGVGLQLDISGVPLQVDYGFRATDYFENVQMFTLSATL